LRPLRRLAIPLGLAALYLAVLASPAHATIFGPRAPHSPNAEEIRTAYWVAIAIATLLIVAVHVALLAALFRFRDRRGHEPRRFVAAPRALLRPGAALALLASAVLVFGIVMTSRARDVEPTGPSGLGASANLLAQVGSLHLPSDTGGPTLTINAIGQQWLWRFEYPSDQPGPPAETFSYNELVVPVDTTVILRVTSTDVLHRWFVPALGGQVDAVAGQTSTTWFRADREGVYPGQSTSYSGPAYSAMRAWVRVVTPDEYEQWVDQQTSDLADAQGIVDEQLRKGEIPGGAP
jgi:cytochrome c oxidase subunit 2